MPPSKDTISKDFDNGIEDTSAFQSSSRSAKRKNTAAPTVKGGIKLFVVLVFYILFNLFGGYIFTLIEKKSTEGTKHQIPDIKREFISNHSLCLSYEELEKFISDLEKAVSDGVSIIGNDTRYYPEVWTLNNGFILAFTIASTIGYGLVTPVTAGGKVFAIVFAFLSIPFTGILAAKIGWIMAYYIEEASTRFMGLVQKANVAGLLFTLLCGLLLYAILPSILLTFVGNEEEWSFVTSLYCVVITLTTIGFGDYVPDPSTQQGGILASVFVLVWVVAGLAWFATIVQLIATQMSRQAKSLRKKVKVTSPPLIKRFNQSGKMKNKNLVKGEVAGQDNGAVLVKVSAQEENSRDSDGVVKEEKIKEVRSSLERMQEEDLNIGGPGGFHAVFMANMSSQEENLGHSN